MNLINEQALAGFFGKIADFPFHISSMYSIITSDGPEIASLSCTRTGEKGKIGVFLLKGHAHELCNAIWFRWL